MKNKTFNKTFLKKNSKELQQYLMFKRRGSVVENKKGRGSYKRKQKHKNDCDYNCA